MNKSSHAKVMPYQHSWSDKYRDEEKKLRNIFGNFLLEVEHIGSTSVEGLAAKSIIDIVVIIENSEDVDSFIEPLNKIGYKFHSFSTERHFYTKGDPIEYHLSIAYADKGGFWKRQILFRDFLRNHKEFVKEYTDLKLGLLKKDPTCIKEYLEGKSEFVYKILKLAGWKENEKYR